MYTHIHIHIYIYIRIYIYMYDEALESRPGGRSGYGQSSVNQSVLKIFQNWKEIRPARFQRRNEQAVERQESLQRHRVVCFNMETSVLYFDVENVPPAPEKALQPAVRCYIGCLVRNLHQSQAHPWKRGNNKRMLHVKNQWTYCTLHITTYLHVEKYANGPDENNISDSTIGDVTPHYRLLLL